MANPDGTPIWYELQSADPAASKAFYDDVMGWSIEAQPAGDMDYRMIATGANGDGGHVGGVMRLTDAMTAGGASAGWSVYIGVTDVDATCAAITANGGRIVMGPWDIPNVGRIAIATDPQGIAFYVMRGATDGESSAFDPAGLGKCSWNELVTPDQAGANRFYAAVFGWTYPDKMTMPGDMGDYVFVQIGDRVPAMGATMTTPPGGPPPGWRFYFRAADIDVAAAKVTSGGGTVQMGPHDVPGGDRIIVASDPHGVTFGVVARAVAAA